MKLNRRGALLSAALTATIAAALWAPGEDPPAPAKVTRHPTAQGAGAAVSRGQTERKTPAEERQTTPTSTNGSMPMLSQAHAAQAGPGPVVSDAPPTAMPGFARDARTALAALDTALIGERVAADPPAADAFAARNWFVPPPTPGPW